MVSTVDILGVKVHKVTLDEAVERVLDLVNSSTETNLVVTANPEIVMLARSNSEFKNLLDKASLVTADGIGIVIGSRILGRELPQRVTGIDLTTRLFQVGSSKGLTFYFLGAAPGVVEEAATNLRCQFPQIKIIGTSHGFFQDSAKVIEDIKQAQPDLLLVALGMGRQEKWIWDHRHELGVPVAIGVGGSFDVFAGRASRAPKWMQRLGLEWLYRLMKEPWRYKRMLVLPKFLWRVWRSNN